MLDIIKIRAAHGSQYIKDIRAAKIHERFRGFPMLGPAKDCKAGADICPSKAINTSPFSIDLGKCVFCGECQRACGGETVRFTNFHKLASTSREKLVITPGMTQEGFYETAVQADEKMKKLFGRSLKLRNVSAGGCNACEMELNASSNVNFDMGRFGIDIVASPRHADGVIITGPITKNMAAALLDTYRAIPNPKLVILAGSCAISGGVFAGSQALDRSFLDEFKPDLYLPGCPVHPLTIINGILDLLGQ